MAKPIKFQAVKPSSFSAPFNPDDFNVVTGTPGADGTLLEATALRDLLAPLPTNSDSSTTATSTRVYRWSALGDSTLKKGPRNQPNWDVVTQYQQGDWLDAPDSITTTQITQATGSVRKLNAGQIQAKGVGGKAFAAHTAVAFTYNGPNTAYRNGMFVVLNDGRAGYQHKTDALIFLQDFNFAGASAEPSTIRLAPEVVQGL